MNIRLIVTVAAVALATAVHAQQTAQVRVRVGDIKTQLIQTPQFQASNVPAKAWRPRSWLELDTTFDVEKAPTPGDTSPFVDQLEFKYYLVLNKQSKGNKYIMLSATVIYTDIPTKDKVHALAYVSPASLTRLLEKNDFTASDVKAVGVEVNYGGSSVGGKSPTGTKFWEKQGDFDGVDGALLPKNKTPFAPMWGDYDVDVKQQ